jgi:hypothetical protein
MAQKVIIVPSITNSGKIDIKELEKLLKKGYTVEHITAQIVTGDNSFTCYYGDFLVILNEPKKEVGSFLG